jgi:pyruvate ferredoxin oxidoreductase beta subunit
MILGLPEEELFAPGHKACAGCGAALAMRYALKAAGRNTIVAQATGCMEVVSTPYPATAWRVPYIHVAFENAAAVASGIARALKKVGRDRGVNVLAIGGDGGTFDIGLQALSGAAERKENICYLCYENGAYMNTGVQRSGATPMHAATTTSPAATVVHGKKEPKKPMPMIMAAHGCYVATANIAYPQDFVAKMKKALAYEGTSYVQVFCPCPPGWRHDSALTITIARLAFETKAYPLFEVESGLVKLKKVGNPKPVREYLKLQGRFKHLNEKEIAEIQRWIDGEYEKLKKLEECGVRI